MELRPDDDGKFIHGVPYGQDLRRHDRHAPGRSTATGDAGLLLHAGEDLANCVLNRNRNADCPEGYAYECYGPNRPEVNNPAVTCGNGLREGELHPLLLPARAPTSRLRAGQGRH